MFSEEEVFFICPYCAQRISVLLESLYGQQSYIEDCEVCCQPIQLFYSVEAGVVVNFSAERADS